jgi:hypothetical protein
MSGQRANSRAKPWTGASVSRLALSWLANARALLLHFSPSRAYASVDQVPSVGWEVFADTQTGILPKQCNVRSKI